MAAWENTDDSRNLLVRGAVLAQLPPLPLHTDAGAFSKQENEKY